MDDKVGKNRKKRGGKAELVWMDRKPDVLQVRFYILIF